MVESENACWFMTIRSTRIKNRDYQRKVGRGRQATPCNWILPSHPAGSCKNCMFSDHVDLSSSLLFVSFMPSSLHAQKPFAQVSFCAACLHFNKHCAQSRCRPRVAARHRAAGSFPAHDVPQYGQVLRTASLLGESLVAYTRTRENNPFYYVHANIAK